VPRRGEIPLIRDTIAAAVVVDAGGAASHAAIVGREYRLPAVMGALGATARLRDSDRVLVGGTAGWDSCPKATQKLRVDRRVGTSVSGAHVVVEQPRFLP
jgi:phosphoenolpyruvate-protein kinase (PTS system EI component)